jgi:2-phosphosulfolactate phosphatase
LPHFNVDGKIVVVIDVFRATSAIITGMQFGVSEIIPVKDIEDALEYKARGYITAAERKGEVVEGFDFGNSPFAFMEDYLRGQTVVLTTSNCTNAMLQVRHAKKTLVGAFTNITAVIEMLDKENDDIVLLCAGWKSRFSLEDSLCAGAIVERLISDYDFYTECDSALAASELYKVAKTDIQAYLQKSSHHHRLKHLNIGRDIEYCLKQDQAQVVPWFDGHSIKVEKVFALIP